MVLASGGFGYVLTKRMADGLFQHSVSILSPGIQSALTCSSHAGDLRSLRYNYKTDLLLGKDAKFKGWQISQALVGKLENSLCAQFP